MTDETTAMPQVPAQAAPPGGAAARQASGPASARPATAAATAVGRTTFPAPQTVRARARSAARRVPGPIGVRLALAFVMVAVLAVALVAVLAISFTERDLAGLVQLRRDDLTRSLASDAVSTYTTGSDDWSGANLRPALTLAAADGAQVAVVDAGGQVVASTLTVPVTSDDLVRRPLSADGRPIGTLLVKFTGQGLAESAGNVRSSLVHADIGAAVLAAVLALLISALVSRRISRPVGRLIASARAMGRGDHRVRVGPVSGAPAELQELATAFDQMADALTAQEQLRRDLVADVAHELRTPVAVLQANTEALVDGVVPNTPEQTASLHEEVVRLGRLVGDLQTLAAAEAAALQLRLQPVELAEIAAAAAEGWETSFASAGIALDRQLTSAPVLGDAGRLHQVIGNLLSNARKFTPAGGEVTVRLTTSGGQARLEVRDSGPGISPADRPHVFDRLWRGSASAGSPGSGIGLAVSAELARAHNGSIEVASEQGAGATFTLVLPLAPAR